MAVAVGDGARRLLILLRCGGARDEAAVSLLDGAVASLLDVEGSKSVRTSNWWL